MKFNVLKLGEAVESAFSAPNPVAAISLVLAAAIVAMAIPLALGIQANLVNSAISTLLSTFVSFFVLAILLYIVAFVLKGKETVSGNFSGIVSALGLLQIPIIIALLVSIIAIPFVLSPLALELVRDVGSGKATVEVFAIQAKYLVENDIDLVNLSALYAFGAVFALIMLFNLCLFYKIVSKVFNYRVVGNIIILAIMLFIMGFLPF